MANDEVIVLGYWSSSYAKRVQIALAEKGVEYEYKEEEGLWYNKSPLLLKSNPVYKIIPVLIHNGKPICESLNIVQYIDEAWKEQSVQLLPQDLYLRAKARFWTDFIDKKILDVAALLWKSNGEAKVALRNELIEHLKLLESELGDKPYIGGESFGYPDIALIADSPWLAVCEKYSKFSIEEECPKLKAWMKRCMERESVSKNTADYGKVYEYMIHSRKRLGIE